MIDRNDPRLTAFALGELTGAELQEVEAAVAASPELQREVAAIEQGASLLQASLGTEACPALTDAQRAAIEAESIAAPPVQLPPGRSSSLPAFALAAVASLLLLTMAGLAGMVYFTAPGRSILQPVAQHDAPSAIAPAPSMSSPQPGDGGSRGDWTEPQEESVEFFSNQGAQGPMETSEGDPGMLDLLNDELRYRRSDGEPAVQAVENSQTSGPHPFGDSVDLPISLPQPDAPLGPGFGGERAPGRLMGGRALGGDAGGAADGGVAGGGLPGGALPADSAPARNFPVGDVRSAIDDGTPAEPTEGITRGGVFDGKAQEGPAGNDDLTTLPGKPADPFGEAAPSAEAPDEAKEVGEAEEVDKSELSPAELRKKWQQNTWVRSRATPNASQLMIGDQDGLPLEGMQVNVLVDGFRARVLLDLYYFNDRGNRLEGNFKLRLPNEASLYYFAFGQSAYEYRPMRDQLASKGFLSGELLRDASLDPLNIIKSREGSWTDVKEARVVTRAKAAHAYSETVRRRVDPALVEWSGAGVFNARVFPLMPNKLHRVVVGYDVNLQQRGDDLVYDLELPEDQGQCVVDLNVSAMPGVTAEVTPSRRPFTSGGRAYYNFDAPDDQAISVRFKNAGSLLLTGDEPAGKFFVSRITPELPADETNASSSRAMFLVDTSLSSRPDKFNVWLEMLEAVLDKNRDSIDEFAVLFFNIESNWWKKGYRKNNEKNVEQLLADCHTLSLEGATDLRQALREATSPEWAQESAADNAPRPDLFLLSDGAVTWGEMNVHRLSQTLQQAESGPLFAYQTGMTGTAVGMLEHLTRETGGAVFSVVNADEIPEVARAHRQRPWQLIDVALPGGSDVLVAGRPKFIYPGQTLLVAGRGQPDAEATVRVRRGSQQKVIEVAIDRTLDSGLAPRCYGQVAVGQLEDLGSRIEDVAVAYARHFRVTGQTCSLLMLESEADYQRFNIKPEEDAFLVRTSPAADLITAKLDELAEQLGDAKTALVDWLEKLETTPGLQYKTPTPLRLVLERLPREAFEVDPARLICSEKKANDETHAAFLRQLDGRLDYNAVANRAAARFGQVGAADALRTLSSLIENNPGDPVLTRDVAFSALEWGMGGQAFHLLKRVAALRPYEPQTYQAMSLCLAETGHADLAMVYYEVALNANWHNRYLDVKQIVGVEYVDLLRRIERGDVDSHARDYAVARLETMRGRVPVNKADLVVTMMWNTDRTDVDLHVIEPSGEECYYEHPRTRMGGRMTRDVTEGFGPEMYTLGQAKPGDYRILANYYGSDANRTNLRSKVYVTVYRNYGDPKRQWVEKKTITLADRKEKRELMTIKVKE